MCCNIRNTLSWERTLNRVLPANEEREFHVTWAQVVSLLSQTHLSIIMLLHIITQGHTITSQKCHFLSLLQPARENRRLRVFWEEIYQVWRIKILYQAWFSDNRWCVVFASNCLMFCAVRWSTQQKSNERHVPRSRLLLSFMSCISNWQLSIIHNNLLLLLNGFTTCLDRFATKAWESRMITQKDDLPASFTISSSDISG